MWTKDFPQQYFVQDSRSSCQRDLAEISIRRRPCWTLQSQSHAPSAALISARLVASCHSENISEQLSHFDTVHRGAVKPHTHRAIWDPTKLPLVPSICGCWCCFFFEGSVFPFHPSSTEACVSSLVVVTLQRWCLYRAVDTLYFPQAPLSDNSTYLKEFWVLGWSDIYGKEEKSSISREVWILILCGAFQDIYATYLLSNTMTIQQTLSDHHVGVT